MGGIKIGPALLTLIQTNTFKREVVIPSQINCLSRRGIGDICIPYGRLSSGEYVIRVQEAFNPKIPSACFFMGSGLEKGLKTQPMIRHQLENVYYYESNFLIIARQAKIPIVKSPGNFIHILFKKGRNFILQWVAAEDMPLLKQGHCLRVYRARVRVADDNTVSASFYKRTYSGHGKRMHTEEVIIPFSLGTSESLHRMMFNM